MSDSHLCLLETEALLLSSLDPFGGKIPSYHGPSLSAPTNRKGGLVTGVTILI